MEPLQKLSFFVLCGDGLRWIFSIPCFGCGTVWFFGFGCFSVAVGIGGVEFDPMSQHGSMLDGCDENGIVC